MWVQLPLITKAKLKRQMLVQKERGFIQVLCDMGDWPTPLLNADSCFPCGKTPIVSPARPRQNPVSRFPAPF